MNDIKKLKGMLNTAGSGELPNWVEPGRKFDSEKPKMYLLPPKATVEVAKVLTFGAAKYDEDIQWRCTSAHILPSGWRARRSRNKFVASSARYLLFNV